MTDEGYTFQKTDLGCARCGNRWTGDYSRDYKLQNPVGPLIACPSCGSRFGVHPAALDVKKPKGRTYSDNAIMPFGEHAGKHLSEVPAAYLCWLWSKRPISDPRLENYIEQNLSALKLEHKDGIWD